MLKRIYADNFRALVNFEFRPGRLNLLLGENGSGKTSLFDVLGKIRDLIVLGAPTADLFSRTRTCWDNREVQRFELEFEASGGTYRYALEIQHSPEGDGGPSLRSESVTFDGASLFQFGGGEVRLYQENPRREGAFPFRSDRSFLINIDAQGGHRTPRLAGFKAFVEGLWIIQPNPFGVEWFSRVELPFLARDGRNLASYFNFLNSERPEVRTELEDRLREALPGFRNFIFQRIGDQKLLRAAFDLQGKPAELNLGELSEGQRVLAILYAAVLGLPHAGAPICFDEPDNFVSLPEIQPWLLLLRDVCENRGGQAMVISHHPEVMDYLALDSAWHFDRSSGPVQAKRIERDETPGDEALRLSELFARGM